MGMRLKDLVVLAIAGLGLSAGTVRPKEPPPSTEIDDTVCADHVRVLASDEFQGRKPGTTGEDKTVSYLVDNFKKLGLKPGQDKSYVQSVLLLQITAGADAALSASGPKFNRNLIYGKEMLI